MNSPSALRGAPPAPTADPRRWLMLAVTLVAMFMGVFDFYVVNIATPSLQSQLHAGQATLELVIGGYTFTYASLLVTGGRLGDVFSYRRMFIFGMSLFTVASLLCGLAQTGDQLVGARLLQGLGAALMVPQVVALITVTFPPTERPRALSWFGVTLGLALVSGQILGGLLLTADAFDIGWRVIFLVNLPVGLVTVALASRLLPRVRGARRPRQDLVGTAGLAISLGLAILPLILGRTEGWPAWTWIMLGLSVPAMAATVLYERALPARGGEPLIDLTLFRTRSFTVGLLTMTGIMTFYSGFIFGMTLFLQAGLHLDPLEAGLTFGPLGIGFASSSLMARRLTTKYGSKVISAGQAMLVLGTLALLLELRLDGVDTSAVRMIAPLIFAGLGTGLTIPSLTGVVVSQVMPRQAGVASGLLATAQQFANTIGVAVFGVVFFDALGPTPSRGDFVSSLEWVAGVGMGLSLVTLVLSFLLPRDRQQQAGPQAAPAGPRQSSPAAEPSSAGRS
ncbi:MAG TPA: MFS transporter [Kribbella sp.]|nr:MFS transporter [Kribbella sp.]